MELKIFYYGNIWLLEIVRRKKHFFLSTKFALIE